jgi:chemotaxis protein MotA
MINLGGIGILLVLVFGIYIITGGKLDIVMHALPGEGGTILGAAIATVVIGNSPSVLGKIVKDITAIMKGPRWKPDDYKDLLCLMFALTKLAKQKGLMAIEQHIEKPGESAIFQQYPKILADHFAVDLICDNFRMISMSVDDPHVVEDAIERSLKKHHEESLKGAKALGQMADGLPALGIVAAVLGVVKTMGSIDQPPVILGAMIGGALVGTFLGVLLAYGIVGPLGNRAKQIHEADGKFYEVIRNAIVSYLHGHAPQVSVELGRQHVPTEAQPSFVQVEEACQALKVA